jgi:fructose-bisphosphate aldolase class II
MRQLLDEAAKSSYGVGAFNVNNMEQIQAIMEAARETRSPVIIQAIGGSPPKSVVAVDSPLNVWSCGPAGT